MQESFGPLVGKGAESPTRLWSLSSQPTSSSVPIAEHHTQGNGV